MQYEKNWKTLIPIVSLLFNVISMIVITDFFSSMSSEFKNVSASQILKGLPMLLIVIGIILSPWIIAIKMSISRGMKGDPYIFSIITLISCIFIIALYNGPIEGIGYNIIFQVIIAWVTIYACSFIKNS